jgi:hypothetical protein
MNTSLEALDSTFSKFCLHAQIGTQISVFSLKMNIFVWLIVSYNWLQMLSVS